MINFLVHRAGTHCIRDYLQARGRAIANRVHVVEHEDLGRLTHLPLGGTIFAALDEATPAATAACALIHDQLASADASVARLNDPRKVLRRFDLLTGLHEAGCNHFRVIRALDDPRGLRFPVFIRPEHRHDGSLTSLLPDRRALDRALAELVFRGMALSDLLVVEFCDTSDGHGLFRKYSAMRIGDVILPRHLHVSRDWVTKSGNSLGGEALIKEELAYLEHHPHERWLRQVFATAHIEYGRIDYGIHRGEPQVWEINMNATLGRNAKRAPRQDDQGDRRLRESGRAKAHQRMLEAFNQLDPPGPAREVPIVVDQPLRSRLDREATQVGRQSVAEVVGRGHPRIRRLMKHAVSTSVAAVAPVVTRFMRRRYRLAQR